MENICSAHNPVQAAASRKNKILQKFAGAHPETRQMSNMEFSV